MRTLLNHMICTLLCATPTFAGTAWETTGGRPPLQIVPLPLSVELLPGSFRITPETRVAAPRADAQLRFTAEFLRDALKAPLGYSLRVVEPGAKPGKNTILLTVVRNDELGPEGYVLRVTPSVVTVEAGGTAGAFYGAQTILQMLPAAVYGRTKARVRTWTLPCVLLRDRPRYPWRGMHMDVSRHFFSKATVKKFIDGLAMHKMNTFHWHLCDDQGWRIEIQKYPRLTQVSAWRADREPLNWNVRQEQKPGEPATYGGFYTQDDIREVVEYAAKRSITVVPEIEMPAHASAVLAAYPEFSCTGGPFTVPTGSLWPIKDIYCAGNDQVFAFLEDVLTEVIPLFPGPYIHIGGDEADKTEWKRCPKCQARITAEKLKDEAELQSFFVKRIERFLTAKGKRLIGWDEILEGGLPPSATVQSWRGIAGGIEAARSGHDVVMSPTSHCYLDYYQGDWRTEPVAIGGYVPLSKVYSYEPTPDSLTESEAKHILGTQGNLWAEFIPDQEKLEYMAYPRIAAIAEAGWTAKSLRNWDDFARRMETQMARYAHRRINASRAAFTPVLRDTFDTATGVRLVRMEAEIGQDRIRYTRDGKPPSAASPLYASPLSLKNGETISAAVFSGSTPLGEIRRREFFVTPGEKPVVSSMTPLDSPYTRGSLTGNVRATGGSRDPEWMGVKGKDFEAVVDFGTVRQVKRLAAGFYQSPYELVFLPAAVTFEVSEDGKTYRTVKSIRSDVSPKTPQALMKDFVASIPPLAARYIRMTAQSLKVCPDWHKQAGEPAWMLFDELSAE
jgi:hexosaminidase